MIIQSWMIIGFIAGWIAGMLLGKPYDITLGIIGGLVGGSFVALLFMVFGVEGQDNVVWGVIAYAIAAMLLMLKRAIITSRLKMGTRP